MVDHAYLNDYLVPEMRHIRQIHFVGIGGAGMSGIAEVLKNQGYDITGSDVCNSEAVERLQKIGVQITLKHEASNVQGADVVVISTAVLDDNPEVLEAHARGIPVVARAAMLAELMRYRYGIAISGTHGKTTTSSLIASIFDKGGLDPTFVIGGKLRAMKSNARLGKSRYLVAEADESDASFLRLQPMVAVVTNIDQDHMVTYDGDFSKLKASFIEFVHHVPFYGAVVLCLDCPVVRELIPKIKRKIITYGTTPDADYRATNIKYEGGESIFTLERSSLRNISIRLNLPGRHNVLNALAAIAVGIDEGIPENVVAESVSEFSGVDRRFQLHGEYLVNGGHVLLVDDYGHHPTEVKVVVDTVRAGWLNRRLVMVFQPHRYSRVYDLYDEFVRELSRVDVLIVMDVYAAGETPIEGADSQNLVKSIKQQPGVGKVFYASSQKDAICAIFENIQGEDVLVIQGAGDVGVVASYLSDNKMKNVN